MFRREMSSHQQPHEAPQQQQASPPQSYETPAATQVSLQRRGLWEYHLSPIELSREKLEIELSSYRLPARNYSSDQEMKQELVAEKVNLRLVSAE